MIVRNIVIYSPLEGVFDNLVEPAKNTTKLFLLLKSEWPYLWGGIAIAIVNTLILVINKKPWGVTTSVTFLTASMVNFLGLNSSHWPYFKDDIRYHAYVESWYMEYTLIIIIGFLIGAVLSSIISREFSWKKISSKKQVFFALAGGFIMGYGARLASGCNIGALVGGISSLSLHGWVFAVAAFIGAFLGVTLLMKYW
jgi:uncharacterized membrane protein YedE/YeeE